MKVKAITDFLLKVGEIDPESETNTVTLHMTNGNKIELPVNSDWWDEAGNMLRIGEIPCEGTAYLIDCDCASHLSF